AIVAGLLCPATQSGFEVGQASPSPVDHCVRVAVLVAGVQSIPPRAAARGLGKRIGIPALRRLYEAITIRIASRQIIRNQLQPIHPPFEPAVITGCLNVIPGSEKGSCVRVQEGLVIPITGHNALGGSAALHPPLRRLTRQADNGNPPGYFRNPVCCVGIERQRHAARIADDVVGKNSGGTVESSSLSAPL